MTPRRIFAALVCGALLLSFTACDTSPGSIGSDVGDDDLQGGDPTAFSVVADSFTLAPVADPVTGSSSGQGWRALVGRVDDPIAGTVTADAYIDIGQPDRVPPTIRDAPRSNLRAELSLIPTYVHGDTTASFEVTVFDLAENQDFDGVRSGTEFADSTEVATYTLSADEDSVLTIELPDAWLDDHLAQLRDTSETDDGTPRILENFNGLRIRPASSTPSPGAVIGFSAQESVLRLVRTDTTRTIEYPVTQAYTDIAWNSDTATQEVPSDRLLLRGGDDRAVRFAFSEFSEDGKVRADSLLGAPLNRVRLNVPLDSISLIPDQENFVRPSLNGYRLLMKRSDGAPECDAPELRLAVQTENNGLDPGDEEGTICFVPSDPTSLPTAMGSSQLFNAVEWTLRPNVSDSEPASPFASFRLEVTDRLSRGSNPTFSALPGVPTTAPVLLYRPTTDEARNQPRFSIVATPL